MCDTTRVYYSKSETLFNAINYKFVKDNIYWQNVISARVENKSASMEIRDSVKSRILQEILIFPLQDVIAT